MVLGDISTSVKNNKRHTLSYREHGCVKHTAVIFLTVIFDWGVSKLKKNGKKERRLY